MSYDKPGIKLNQSFSSSSTVVSDLKATVVVVGPAYTMVDDEEHSHVTEPYIGSALTLTFGSANADIRATTNGDELEYPVEVTFEDAKCLVNSAITGLAGGPVTGTSAVTLTAAGEFAKLPSTGTRTIKFTADAGTSKHYVDVVSVSARDGSNMRTITLNGPLAKDLDLPATGFRRYLMHTDTVNCTVPLAVVSIGSDRKTMIVQDRAVPDPWWKDVNANVFSAGMYTIGYSDHDWGDPAALNYIHPTLEKNIEFVVASKVDNGSITTYDIGPNMQYSGVTAESYYYHDVVEDDALGAGYPLTSTQITIPANTADSSGFLIKDATVHLKYRALKTSLANSLTRIDISAYATDIASKLGAIVEENTGAWGVNEACKGSKIDVFFLGLGSTYFSNPLSAFTTAESSMRSYDVYHLVFQSMRTDVNSLLMSHVKYMSDENICKWRVGYVNRALVTETSVADGITGTAHSEGVEVVGTTSQTVTFTDSDASFVGSADEDYIVKLNSWTLITPIATVYGGITITDTITGAAGPNDTPITWTSATKTMTLTYTVGSPLTNLLALVAAGKLIGRNIFFTKTGALNTLTPTSNDTSMYIDSTHPLGSNSQTFAQLGYKVADVIDDGVSLLTIRFEAVGTAPTLNLTWAGTNAAETVTVSVFDSILDATTEASLQETGLVIGSVIDNHTLAMDEGLYNWGTSGSPDWHRAEYEGLDYDIYREMTKDEQAAYVAAYATSFAERRIRMIWPDKGESLDGKEIKGYQIACAAAGAYAGYNPQESMTRHFISGPNTIEHSNDYFSDSQLDIIAEGGVTIFTQSVEGANIQCRHNQSTDTSTVYYREPSITHSVDRASYMVALTLDRLIGIYNITQELFDVSTTALESIKTRVEKVKPRVGGILRRLDIISVRQDPSEIDHVEVTLDAIPNVPCNGFNVTMRVK